MKRLILLLALLPCVSYAGTFTQIREGLYEFNGPMYAADVLAYKRLFAENTEMEIVVDSPGGSLQAGIDMADWTRQYNFKVRLTAKECYSAAALWVSADPDFRYYDKDALLAWHIPWLSRGGTPQEQTLGETSIMAYDLGSAMNRSLGEGRTRPLFQDMCDARDWKGINSFVVWKRDEPTRIGLWTETGWEWKDKSPSSMVRLDPRYIKP